MNLPCIRLEFRDPPRHSKYYELLVEEYYNMNTGQSGHVVTFRYGRIGRPPLIGTKTPKPVGLQAALAIFEKYKREKLNEGYREVSGVVEGNEKAKTKKITQTDSDDEKPPARPRRNLIV